jgi:heme A synthase
LLGISTLLLHVPVVMATAHQGAGLLLLTVALYIVYLTGGKIRSEQQ